ncbi:Uncharacterized protein dnl_59800 [Desulfonema limicola]|uniref:Uncharacterized protein n=1 Tax=Desulfonema limicola TaxID=45656 RepID=A0A975BDV8_9BACT|nr:hypothetical protein [Desulfonema limicola]QTA83567.1 Uncharacterized protein dnl_59800 [Desulfonema limicola]
MGIFKEETETKRVIFNIRIDLAQRLEKAKKDARSLGKKLDVSDPVDKALEKFLKRAEKRIADLKKKKGKTGLVIGDDDEVDDNDEVEE